MYLQDMILDKKERYIKTYNLVPNTLFIGFEIYKQLNNLELYKEIKPNSFLDTLDKIYDMNVIILENDYKLEIGLL